jgi:isopenicillin N synthase-like dioxygenase
VNLNWYPPADPSRPPEPGQYRIGPHTDFGTVTVLDREPGRGGLQIYTLDGTVIDAP